MPSSMIFQVNHEIHEQNGPVLDFRSLPLL
jgi:hypothetical protein